MGLLDFFSREAGQERRRKLDDTMRGLLEDYVPPELHPWIGYADYLNPVSDVGRAMQSSERMMDPALSARDRLGAGVSMLTDVAAVTAPAAVARYVGAPAVNGLVESLSLASMPVDDMATRLASASPGGLLDDALRFVADDAGAIRFHHGSPHKFDAFDSGKIGTGEGSQMYGHGLYGAEARGAAETYAEQLGNMIDPAWTQDWLIANGVPPNMAYTSGFFFDRNFAPTREIMLDSVWREPGMTQDIANIYARGYDESALKEGFNGYVYDALAYADPADMVNWDAPLRDQPENVKAALRKTFDARYGDGFFDKYASGPNTYEDIVENFDEIDPAELSAALNEAGVPGVRYLDQFSRKAGSGTNNYVFFDDGVLDITARDGVPMLRNQPQGGLLDRLRAFVGDDSGSVMLPLGGNEPTRAPFEMPGGMQGADDLAGIGPHPTMALPAGSDPRYLGPGVDRSEVSYLRYHPKEESARMTGALDVLRDKTSPARIKLEADIDAGLKLGGADWYNTEELRDWFIHYLGPQRGDAEWRQFMELMGTASPGSKVDANIGNASMLRNRMATDPEYVEGLLGVENLKDGQALARTRPKGYGHKTAGLQELATARYSQGGWSAAPEPHKVKSPASGSWTEQAKPKGFMNSLLGNRRNMAADLHYTRYMGMASGDPRWLENVNDVSREFMDDLIAKNPDAAAYFKMRDVNGKAQPSFSPKRAVQDGVVTMDEIADYPPVWAQKPNDNEYAAFEDLITEIGRDRGLTPAQAQAALWMGAAKRTGVDDASQGTFMELFRNRVAKRAAKDKISNEEVIRRFIVDKGLLALPFGGLLAGGLPQEEPQL